MFIHECRFTVFVINVFSWECELDDCQGLIFAGKPKEREDVHWVKYLLGHLSQVPCCFVAMQPESWSKDCTKSESGQPLVDS